VIYSPKIKSAIRNNPHHKQGRLIKEYFLSIKNVSFHFNGSHHIWKTPKTSNLNKIRKKVAKLNNKELSFILNIDGYDYPSFSSKVKDF